jgi:murein DD-endopeptidase MepM/ murein hydrolase activator NlpD
MMDGSATVAAGDQVEEGQAIGRVGNSGNSSEPHLHFHLADRWDGLDPVGSAYTSQGVPAVFWDARVRRGGRSYRLNGASVLDQDLVEP